MSIQGGFAYAMYFSEKKLSWEFDSSLCSSQTSDWNAVWRAGYVGQASFVAEFYGCWVAAVFAADAQFDVRTGLFTQFSCHFNQFTNTGLVQFSEWIAFIDLVGVVVVEEFTSVVTGEAEGHLSQVVGTEGEEFSFFSYLVCCESSTWGFDHGPYMVF